MECAGYTPLLAPSPLLPTGSGCCTVCLDGASFYGFRFFTVGTLGIEEQLLAWLLGLWTGASQLWQWQWQGGSQVGGCQIVNIFVGHVAAQEKILHFSLGIINDVLKKPPKPPPKNTKNIALSEKEQQQQQRAEKTTKTQQNAAQIPTAAVHMNNCADAHTHMHAYAPKRSHTHMQQICAEKYALILFEVASKAELQFSLAMQCPPPHYFYCSFNL